MGDNNDENYNAEEQEMEAQALEAIFDKNFSILLSSSSTSQTTQQWSIELYPEQQGEDGVNNSNDVMNYVGCKLIVTLPIDYPELSIPTIDIEIIKGLADEHRITIQELATEEAKANIGTPCIFAIAERIREWLADNNISGLDDISMHAIMMRKEKEKQQREEKQSQRINTIYESHQNETEMTQAEIEELMVNKRRSEGTPCNKENFLAWQEKFDNEMKLQHAQSIQQQQKVDDGKSGKSGTSSTSTSSSSIITGIDKSGRLTGSQYFSDKSNNNYEALAAAAEMAAENEPIDDDDDDDDDNDNDIDEELFDDDVDLDDLEFDDDDDDDEDDLNI